MLPAGEKIVLVLEAIGDDKIWANSSSLDHQEQKKRNAAARGRSMLAQWSPGSMEAWHGQDSAVRKRRALYS